MAFTTFTYDPRGFLTSMTHADGSMEQFVYDPAGRQSQRILADGRVVTTIYDDLGRQTLLIPPAGPQVEQEWDGRSRRISMKDGTGRTYYLYYDDGRVQAVQRGDGTVSYSYDNAGRRSSMTYPAGTVEYEYDLDNNLSLVLNTWGERTSYAWDMAERLNTITLANGSIVSHSYDNASRLVYRGDPNTSGGIGFAYTLDPAGNRVTITENDGSVTTNVCDPNNWLTRETRIGTGAYDCEYSYDENGSLIARDLPGGGRVTFTLDVAGKITGDSAGTAYSYDANGWLLSRSGGIRDAAWGYDYAGRVVSMALDGGATTFTYLLDGDGRVQARTRDGVRTNFLLDGRNVLREWTVSFSSMSGTGSVTPIALRPRELVRVPATAFATMTQDRTDYTYGMGLVSQRTTESYFFRWDGRSTAARIEDLDEGSVEDQVYDAYGLSRAGTPGASAYGFVGEEGVRQEKGLLNAPYHMRARMYDPLLGRFTSRDPIWDSNLYSYGKGNPWSNVDPDGMQSGQPTTAPGLVIGPDGLPQRLDIRAWPNVQAPVGGGPQTGPAPSPGEGSQSAENGAAAGGGPRLYIPPVAGRSGWIPFYGLVWPDGSRIYFVPDDKGGVTRFRSGPGESSHVYNQDDAGFRVGPRGVMHPGRLPGRNRWDNDENGVWILGVPREQSSIPDFPTTDDHPSPPLHVRPGPNATRLDQEEPMLDGDVVSWFELNESAWDAWRRLMIPWARGDFRPFQRFPQDERGAPHLRFDLRSPITQELRYHDFVRWQIRLVKYQLENDAASGYLEGPRRGLSIIDTQFEHYNVRDGLSGVDTALRMGSDAGNFTPLAPWGDVTAAILGSFALDYWVEADPRTRRAIIHFHARNATGRESAARDPRTGRPTVPDVKRGKMFTFWEDIVWDEYITY